MGILGCFGKYIISKNGSKKVNKCIWSPTYSRKKDILKSLKIVLFLRRYLDAFSDTCFKHGDGTTDSFGKRTFSESKTQKKDKKILKKSQTRKY